MFHPVTSFLTLVECVLAHANTFIAVSRSQLSIEVSSNKRYVSFAVFCVLLDHLVHVFDVVIRISRVGEEYTHQFDALAVAHDCAGDGTFVGVFLCQLFFISTSCSVKYQRRVCCHIFPAPMNMCL